MAFSSVETAEVGDSVWIQDSIRILGYWCSIITVSLVSHNNSIKEAFFLIFQYILSYLF